MGDAATATLPNFTTQDATTYKAAIDGGFAIADRLAWAFAPHEQATPDMTVRLAAGAVFDGDTLSEVAAQSSATISAPTTDPRIDRVVIDRATGAVSVIAGAEAASPTPPAIAAGKAPAAQVALSVGQTEILNADITDERDLRLLGLGTAATLDVGTAANKIIQLDGTAKLPAVDGSQLTGIATEDDVARDNIMLNAFRIAINGGLSVLDMEDGIIDEFEDETGIDTGTSTNETYDAANDLYSSQSTAAVAQGAGTAIGDMTANGGLAAAFDGTTSQTGANSAASVGSVDKSYVGKDWGAGNSKTITAYTIYPSNNFGFVGGAATNLTIKLFGSNTAPTGPTDGTELHSSGSFADTTSGQTYNSGITTTTAYRYHWAMIDGDANDQQWCAELEFTELVTSDMTLVSQGFTSAISDPGNARIVLFEEDIDAPTINTDLTAEVSRDGGTTWTSVTLADEGDYETGKQILAGSTDISGQPSGTTMKYRVKTPNSTALNLHGVALQWST